MFDLNFLSQEKVHKHKPAIFWFLTLVSVFVEMLLMILLFLIKAWSCFNLCLSAGVLRPTTDVIIPIPRDEVLPKNSPIIKLYLYFLWHSDFSDRSVSIFLIIVFPKLSCDTLTFDVFQTKILLRKS